MTVISEAESPHVAHAWFIAANPMLYEDTPGRSSRHSAPWPTTLGPADPGFDPEFPAARWARSIEPRLVVAGLSKSQPSS
jgi:hypothetical protein